MAKLSADIMSILEASMKAHMDKAFGDYKHKPHKIYKPLVSLGDYILEQCGKKWRVKKVAYPSDEIKTGWLTYKEADALLKIFKSGEEHGES